MSAYYNEVDPFAAAWLRELISQNLIAPGDVDERSIEDVTPAELLGYTQCHFFAGIGVWSYALRLAGWPDDQPVWTGSCPCQPFSPAGKGKGFADERHLWPAFHHLIEQCGPERVFGEQVAGKDGLGWLDLVSADLEAMGYACGAVPFPAAGIGAPHIRERLYWVADPNDARLQGQRKSFDFDAPEGREAEGRQSAEGFVAAYVRRGHLRPERGADGKVRLAPDWSGFRHHGPAARVGRLRGYGNAIVAQQAQAFIEAYCDVRGLTRFHSMGVAA